MEEFLRQYGYLALTAGTFLEGETAILMASSLVPSGLFNGPAAVIFAFLGSFVSDWLYFTIGKLNGKYFVDKRPALKARLKPVQEFFTRNQVQVLVSYRFLYGFRVLIPLMIGMSNIHPLRFLAFSVVSGLFWASIVSAVGYGAGRFFHFTPQTFTENIALIIIGFVCVGMAIGFGMKRFAEKQFKV